MIADLVIEHATLVTVAGGTGPLRGARQADLGVVPDGAVAVADGRIAAVGPRAAVLRALSGVPAAVFDAGGRVVLPGFVDAHTHPVWAGSRAEELEQRIAGATYVEIMAGGGGIGSTVRATRAASETRLLADLLGRLDRLLAFGVTTVEAKTGYGLSTEEELRHLALLAEADRRHPVRIVPTFLGAHAVPDGFRGRPDAYVDLVVDEMLPAVATAWPGVFCDVFCDDGAFTLAQAERILRRAAALGLGLKAHADEFANLGCTALAAGLGATSVDHLVATTAEDVAVLAARGSVAVLLPGTTFGLGSTRFAPARAMVASGVPVALGTDLNPGTCPSESMPLMLALATRYLRLSTAEAIVAATRNAAYASGRGEMAGRLEPGFAADVIVIDGDDYRDLAYRFGGNPVVRVMVGGRWVAGDGVPNAERRAS
ncbi:imidazolonepropionase [bacterium]|nr:imidazolonepropionase [Chloroflexi bacterium CFX6]RIL12789.1 MAG: imidazolonepropionase [bacterium]